MSRPPKTAAFPGFYKAFYLYIEPVATLIGACAAIFTPRQYLSLTHAESAPAPIQILSTVTTAAIIPTATLIALRQLGNLYFCFAISEALVLRATTDIRVWRAFLLCLLIADFGHLLTCLPLGPEVYYRVDKWNAIDWGNIGFVYCGAATRICFLLGVGLGAVNKAKGKTRKSIAATSTTVEDLKEAVMGPKTPKVENDAIMATAKTPAKSTRRKKTKSVSS